MSAGVVDGVEMLPMPKAAGLARKRINGTVCVWCGSTPTMPLGPRLSVIRGKLLRWHPQACQPCVSKEAARVYRLHGDTCARCSHHDYCQDLSLLHALALGVHA